MYLLNKNYFMAKSYGRIFVINESDINKVKDIIKEIDDYEYEYLPEDFITTFKYYPSVRYTGKFDSLDLEELVVNCISRGIYVWCMHSGDDQCPNSKLIKAT